MEIGDSLKLFKQLCFLNTHSVFILFLFLSLSNCLFDLCRNVTCWPPLKVILAIFCRCASNVLKDRALGTKPTFGVPFGILILLLIRSNCFGHVQFSHVAVIETCHIYFQVYPLRTWRMRRTRAMDARADASGSEEDNYSNDQEETRTGHGQLCSVFFFFLQPVTYEFFAFDKNKRNWCFTVQLPAMFLSCSLSCRMHDNVFFFTECFTTDTCCSRTTGVLPSRDNTVPDAMQRRIRVFVEMCL